MTSLATFTTLSDADLLAHVTHLATCERHATAQLVASLAELDVRRLYLGRGFPSIFTYCTQALHLSEHAAYNRIEAARVARRFPAILDRLADGSITLTAVCLLAAHLTPENVREVLDAAQYKTKRDVEVLVAQLRPLPPVPPSVRKLPAVPAAPQSITSVVLPAPGPPMSEHQLAAPTTMPSATDEPAPTAPRPRPAVVAPLTSEQCKVQVTAGRETIEKLRRAQDLMRHAIPNGDPAAIIDRALTVLVA